MRLDVAGVERDGPPVLGFGVLEVPPVPEERESQRAVGVGERIIEGNGLTRCGHGAGHGVGLGHAGVLGHQVIALGQASVSLSVV